MTATALMALASSIGSSTARRVAMIHAVAKTIPPIPAIISNATIPRDGVTTIPERGLRKGVGSTNQDINTHIRRIKRWWKKTLRH